MLAVCLETSFRRLNNKRKFILNNKYILLPHPLSSTSIYSDAMKGTKMARLQTYNSVVDIKTNAEVIEIYKNSSVMQYLFNILGCLTHS